MKPDPDQLGILLHDGARLIRRRFEQQAASYGLSSAQWRLLVQVLRTGGSTQARLADRLELEPISVSRLVDRMEQAGWVMRQPDPADRRIKVIVATETTHKLKAEVKAIAHAVREAGANDVILLAGKGHEDYQEIAGKKLPFSDVDEARFALEARA